MAVTFGPYFAIVGTGRFHSDGLPDLRQLGLFAAAAIVQMVILVAGMVVAAEGVHYGTVVLSYRRQT